MAIPTKERLAQVLHSAGLLEMEKAARAGRYDDYEGTTATPIIDLVNDLKQTGAHDLAKRAIAGEWDATKEEAEAWYQREGKNLISLRALGREFRGRPVSPEKRFDASALKSGNQAAPERTEESMKEPDLRRNLNPHKAAVIAMSMWGAEYSRQGGGSMDFWDKLSESRRKICREVLTQLQKAPEEVS